MFKITIPEINDAKVKVFVNNEYIGEASVEQVNKIRISVVEYIDKTGDESVLDTFYFVGHIDTPLSNEMGKEIKITMDRIGNLSNIPWEMSHVRRDMFHLLKLDSERNKK